MKKILKFAFAVVAMAGVVFASASCSKDEEGDKVEDLKSKFNYERIKITPPNVVYPQAYQSVGLVDEINFEWEKPTAKLVSHTYDKKQNEYVDSETEITDCEFSYELLFKDKSGNWNSLGKQKELKSKQKLTLEEESTYYYKINVFISYGDIKDSLITNLEVKFLEDVEIPFYSTYEKKHHIWIKEATSNHVIVEWDKDCEMTYYIESLYYREDGSYYTLGDIDHKNHTLAHEITLLGTKVFCYELSGKYTEQGSICVMSVDDSRYTWDGDFNVYEKQNLLNSDKKIVVYKPGVKNIYGEDMFEFSETGKMMRHNGNMRNGNMVTYEDWKTYSTDLSGTEFLSVAKTLLGIDFTDNQTYPFLKNGKYVSYDSQTNGIDYESTNFENYRYIEVFDKVSE